MAFTATHLFSSTASSSSTALHRSKFLDSDFAAPFSHDSFHLINFSRRFSEQGICLSRKKNILFASVNGTNAVSPTPLKSDQDADYIPMPHVLIDQDSNSDATIVQLSFGDRLGALIDTMNALKDLGLDVAKGTVNTEGSVKQTKFFITRLDTGRKVEDPDLLERIRLTIINNLLKYHPESSEQLAMGEAFAVKAPEKKARQIKTYMEYMQLRRPASLLSLVRKFSLCYLLLDIATHIHVKEDGPKRSLIYRNSRSTWITCRDNENPCRCQIRRD